MPEKLKMRSADILEENIEKIRKLFPAAVTEVIDGYTEDKDGRAVPIVKEKVDFEVLKQELSGCLAEEWQERYQMTWPDKSRARALANSSVTTTLRPVRERSVDFDRTENLYIEGDNLDVLKLLRETYLGEVRLIYIDPPYNTGNDLLFCDDFSMDPDDYNKISGQYDKQGNRLVRNLDGNGRFHTDWLNMIFPRLKVARDLLREDGLLFVSIDERELSNLIKVCNEIFSERNLVGIFKWNKTSKAPTLSNSMRNKYEYVLCYVKGKLGTLKGPRSYNTMAPLFNSGNSRSRVSFKAGSVNCLFKDGVYKAGRYGKGEKEVLLCNDLVVKDGVNDNEITLEGRFKWSQSTVDGKIAAGQKFAFKKPTFTTMYYYLDLGEDKSIAPSDLLNMEECGVARNDEGYWEVAQLFGFSPFNYCKPVSLIKKLIEISGMKDGLIMDFFSGSATAAHAVMQLNAEDGGKRRFIMVQIPELCDPKSAAYHAGYETICEIGEERIRRAGDKIVQETMLLIDAMRTGATEKAPPYESFVLGDSAVTEAEVRAFLDVGFRVFRLDSSNMKDVYYDPKALSQAMIGGTVDNIKEDRTPFDLLFQAMLELGVPLSARIEKIGSEESCFSVNGGELVACFAENIGEETIAAIAKQRPAYAVFRDRSFGEDSVEINRDQLFKAYSPKTKVKVI